MTSNGTFFAEAVAGLAALRQAKLSSSACHPFYPVAMDGPRTASPDELATRLRPASATSPIGVALSTPDLDDAALLAVAGRLGSVMPETDAETRPFVSNAAVLSLKAVFDDRVDTALQPFSTACIALHTEGSRAPEYQRPSALIFQCVQPADHADGGQTVVVHTDDIVARLSTDTLTQLGTTRFETHPCGGAVLKQADEVWEMSFRDFRDAPLAWSNDAGAEPAAVNAALAQLALAMYAAPMYALAMQPGTIIYLANARVAHGRTAFARSNSQRLLRRICLQHTRCDTR
jgi:alpha-ketoglutarate-dependent taurine dioxygenase